MSNEIPFVSGLRSVVSAYDAFIVDLWGVIYEEDHLCFGVFNALSQMNDEGKKVIFLSNSPLRVADISKKIEKMGLKRHLYQGILTAGEVMYHELRTRTDPFFSNLGRRCFHLGPDSFWQPYANLGYVPVPNVDEADFVFVTGTFGTGDSLEKYDPFFKACLSRRLSMVCACPDPYIVQNGIPHIAAGALTAQYQKLGGNVFWRGKPDPSVFEYCMEGFEGVDRKRVAVIGDSIVTDLTGASYSKIDALFIAGGVHAKELGVARGQQPDMDRLRSLMRQYDLTVKAVLPAFVW